MITENLESDVDKLTLKEKTTISALLIIYHSTKNINQAIQKSKKRYFKKKGYGYKWVCAEKHKDNPFLDHLYYCIRT